MEGEVIIINSPIHDISLPDHISDPGNYQLYIICI